MSKKLNKRKVLNYLAEYLIITLTELQSLRVRPDFCENEFLAYIDCLEVVSKWCGFKKFGITDIESHFNMV